MKFKNFLFQLMGICFVGLTSVVGASPLDTIPPPITDSFIPVNQRSVEPTRNPGDFIGRVFAPNTIDWSVRWVPVSTVVRPPPKVVSIPDQNLAAAIRKALLFPVIPTPYLDHYPIQSPQEPL